MDGKDPVYYTDNTYTTVLRASTNTTGTATPADNAVMKPGTDGYRLPTEAQGEYAARGGGTPAPIDPFVYKWAGTNDENLLTNYAWYKYNSHDVENSAPDYGTNPVGGKTANTLGLYDMSGNVWEWCWDWHGAIDATETVTDPTGPAPDTDRVRRGGCWNTVASYCAVSYRAYGRSNGGFNDLGFRVSCP
jgi:formylglycine-generating enzyme required for sulfatase activity